MFGSREYHSYVRYLLSASAVFLGVLIVLLLVVSPGAAQINGTPASVTSPGFGGRAINGTPSSVTSLGPRGFAPDFSGTFLVPNARRDRFGRDGTNRRRHRHYVPYNPVYSYAVPVPYAIDIGEAEDASDASAEDDVYQGGPTVFDRRGQGATSYVPPVNDIPAPHAAQAVDPPAAEPEPPQPPTVLVFKDGHQLEVGNYAIVGQTLFDLTPGHARKVALAELDLDATRQQNDNNGVIFQLPPGRQAN